MRQVRVLFVSPTGEIGGAEVALLRLLRHLDRTRFVPRAACLSPGPLLDRLNELGVECTLVPAGRFRHLHRTAAVVAQIARLARHHGSDVIFGNGTKGHLYGALAAKLIRCPAVWWLHDILPTDSGRPLSLNWLATRLPADLVVANSVATAKAARAYYRSLHMLEVVHPGLDIQEIETAVAVKGIPTIRQELGLAEGPLIGMVGRLSQWKGQHVFLDAARLIADQCPAARFLLVGDALFGLEPGYPAFLRARTCQLGLIDHVVFTGYRADALRLMSGLDVVVHASILPEPFGLTVLEGMALGKPVVATALGGVLEIIEPGITGILVPPNDAKALAAAVLQLLCDREGAQRMGLEARQRVREQFTAQRTASQMQQLLANLATGNVRKAA